MLVSLSNKEPIKDDVQANMVGDTVLLRNASKLILQSLSENNVGWNYNFN